MLIQNIPIILLLFGLLVSCKPQNNIIESAKECKVTEKATGDEKSCRFPFVYNDKTFHGCTTEDNGENGGKSWCSTKTDQLNEHDESDSFFGECPEECLSDEVGQKIMEEQVKEGLDSLKPVDLSQTLSVCKCQDYDTCTWSNQVVNQLSVMNKNHPFYVNRKRMFAKRICDRSKQQIWCCRDGDYPREPELEILNREVDVTTDSGKWRPNGNKGECGTRITISNIVGGKKTKLGDFPYMALLGYDIEGDIVYGCGGTLINKWYVLTAAHCPEPQEVVLGEWKTSSNPDCQKDVCAPEKISRKVAKRIIHEEYKATNEPGEEVNGETQRNDIVLLRLDEAVPLYSDDPSKSIASPVCLPWSDYVEDNHPARVQKDNDELVVTGWGRNSNVQTDAELLAKKSFTDVLLKVIVPVTNNITGCAESLTDSTHICAGGILGPKEKGKHKYEGKDSCNGDSGGPLVAREFAGDPWYQAGIVSFGPNECGILGEPGVYTKVAEFLPWIMSKLED